MNPGRRLLFVDDEETIRFAVRDYFGPQGYEVDAVADADAARALLDEHGYAVAVIDLSLGRGQEQLGLDLVSRVRERHPHTPVVLFTAHSTPEVEREARRRGAIVLEKPLPLVVISAAIERLRAEPQNPPSQEIQALGEAKDPGSATR
jgi:DNA-binding NtrC family response regulator